MDIKKITNKGWYYFQRNHFFKLLQVKDPTEYYLLIDTRYPPVQPEWLDLAQKRGFEWEREDERTPYIWSLWGGVVCAALGVELKTKNIFFKGRLYH